MKKISFFLTIISMFLIWFSIDFLNYRAIKKLYKNGINDTIVDIRKTTRTRIEIKFSRENEYYSLNTNNDDDFKIGQLIIKEPNSTEYKIYTFDNKKKEKIYKKSLTLDTNLDIYNLK